jgi:hypothetical protein
MEVLINILEKIEDSRSYHGREYRLHHILLFSILAILSGAQMYSDIHTFIEAHFEKLKERYKLKWRQVPDVSAIRKIIVGTESDEIEKAFREYSINLAMNKNHQYKKHICFDGKALNGSFSKCKDQRASKVFNVFSKIGEIVLAHIPIGSDKDHEIHAFQQFLKDLDLEGVVVTADALHCQKKHLNAQRMREQPL